MKTGVIDAGFEDYVDLLSVDRTPLCKEIVAGGQQKCTRTKSRPHGNHVAGIIGAAFDNNSGEPNRSRGVSGGNPVAQISAVNSTFDNFSGNSVADVLEVFDEMIGTVPDLRVINYSMGLIIPGLVRQPVTGVTDVETGLPLPGVEIKRLNSTQLEVVTDEAGHYVITPIPLGLNNEPQFYNLEAVATLGEYWRLTNGDYAACGEIVNIDFQLIPVHLGSASGSVFVGEPDPNDLSANRAVTPTDVPLEGAVVSNLGSSGVTTDANGFYEFNDLLPNKNNLPKTALLVVGKAGFWQSSGPNVTIEGNVHTDIPDDGLVPQCTADISGMVVFGDTGLPADSIRVDIVHPFSSADSVFTNGAGELTFPDKLLGLNNSSTTYKATLNDRGISIPGYLELKQDIFVERCDDNVVLALELVPINAATLQGHIFDQETGDPIANTSVSFSGSGVSDT